MVKDGEIIKSSCNTESTVLINSTLFLQSGTSADTLQIPHTRQTESLVTGMELNI